MKDEIPRTGYPFVDTILMAWSGLYSLAQTIGIGAIDQSLGVGVGLLTLVLLVYRIALAHEELFDEEEAEAS